MRRKPGPSGTLLLLGAGVSFGSLTLWITWLAQEGVSGWAQVGTRLALGSLFLLIGTRLASRDLVRTGGRRTIAFATLNGLLLVMGFASYIFSITLGTPPVKTALLSQLSPVYVAVLGRMLLKERLNGRKLAAVALGVFGGALTLKVWDMQALAVFQLGDLLGLANGLIVATQLVLARWVGVRTKLHPMTLVLWSMMLAAAALAIVALGMFLSYGPAPLLGQLPPNITPRIGAYILGISIVGTVIPFTLLYLGLARTEASVASVLLLTQPVSVFLFAALFLHQPVGWWQTLGGLAILGAAVLASR